jgi:hypothetical protein
MEVVSKTVFPFIVAAAIFVSAACGALGLMTLVTVKDVTVPAVRVPAVKVTDNTVNVFALLGVRVGVAAAALGMLVKPPATMAVVDVNSPLSVTTTLLKPVTVVGVNWTVTVPLALTTVPA